MSRADQQFSTSEIEDLLVRCHRRCCVCHRFCGVRMEIDHIEPKVDGGRGDIANAIPLCFDCHAEVHHYNPSHPKGRRFTPGELRRHRDQWLRICEDRPDMFVHSQPPLEAGSLERLAGELGVNERIAASLSGQLNSRGGRFEVTQFRRAISDGTLVWLPESIRGPLEAAYVAALEANGMLNRLDPANHVDNLNIAAAIRRAQPLIATARERVLLWRPEGTRA